MTNDETTRLARSMQKIDDGSLNLYEHKVNLLCDHILSGHMRREIENAAYKNVIKLVEEGPYGGDGLEIADAISALIQPPAQKENGE